MAREILEGKVFSSKRYGDFEVLEYLGKSEYSICFIETKYVAKYTKYKILKGEVRDILSPILYNIGKLGDKYLTTHFLYGRWNHMMSRCYNTKDVSYKSYGDKSITVCDRWHNFSNYVDDVVLIEGYNEELVKSGKLHLDKDLINREALTYSPETCKWVTQSENTKESNRRNRQKNCIALRISDSYSEEFYSITDFCNKWNLSIKEVHLCLKGSRAIYMGWKFEYKKNPIKYIKKVMSNSKSGYYGVCKENRSNKWRAYITINSKQTSLGYFTDIKDAIIARYNWEVENQGMYRKPDSKDDYLKSIGYIKQKSAD